MRRGNAPRIDITLTARRKSDSETLKAVDRNLFVLIAIRTLTLTEYRNNVLRRFQKRKERFEDQVGDYHSRTEYNVRDARISVVATSLPAVDAPRDNATSARGDTRQNARQCERKLLSLTSRTFLHFVRSRWFVYTYRHSPSWSPKGDNVINA